MSVESGIDYECDCDVQQEKTMNDIKPASDSEIQRLKDYIKNAKPNYEFNMDAGTLRSLLLRIENSN